MDLPKIREAAANIDRAYKAAQSAKLAKDELDLTFPDETARRQELGGMLADQAGAAKRWLVKAQADLQAAEDELQEKWAEGERARRGEAEFRVPLANRPSTGSVLVPMDPQASAPRAPTRSKYAPGGVPSSERILEDARAIFYVPGEEDASWTQDTADDVSRVLGGAPEGDSLADVAVRGMYYAYWNEDTDSEADRIEDMVDFLHTYDKERAAQPAPVDTGGRELLAVLDPRTRPPLRLVEPDPNAELAAIDRELAEIEGAASFVAPTYDHRPRSQRLLWLNERKGVDSAQSIDPSQPYEISQGRDNQWTAKYGRSELDEQGRAKTGLGARFRHSGLAMAAVEKHYEKARITAEFTTDDSGEIRGRLRAELEGPRTTPPRQMVETQSLIASVDKRKPRDWRAEHDAKAAQARKDNPAVFAGNWQEHKETDNEGRELMRWEKPQMRAGGFSQWGTELFDRFSDRNRPSKHRQLWVIRGDAQGAITLLRSDYDSGKKVETATGQLDYAHARRVAEQYASDTRPGAGARGRKRERLAPSEELARIHSAQEEEARLTREHGDKLRAEAGGGRARPTPSDYSAATNAAAEKAAAAERSVHRMHNKVEKAATKAAQKKAGAGLDNAKAKLKRSRAKYQTLARADAVAWAVKEYARRTASTPVPRGWDASATTISEEILPTPQGVTVDHGYWERPGHDSPPPPAYPGLPVTQNIGAHRAGGVIVEVNKNRTRITVNLRGDKKPHKYSWRKGRGAYVKVGDSGGSGLQLGKSVEYLDPGV